MMSPSSWSLLAAVTLAASCALGAEQPAQGEPPAAQRAEGTVESAAQALVGRLDLERYKATIKGLAQFGDRRQGTDRNRRAVDWIEAQLRSYGCPTERLHYTYTTPPRAPESSPGAPRGSAGRGDRTGQPARGQQAPHGNKRPGQGGSTIFGPPVRPSVNTDPAKQTDDALRALNAQPAADGAREEVFCTKVGVKTPAEMYIIGAHMDGHGWGEAANDDGSGTALVMELARIFSSSDVQTDRSIRFVLWNNEETGLNGARAYVEQRQGLQGREDPPGSGTYPEPRWLGMIQHDMMLFDHGMPGPDGRVSPRQRREADVNIEFQINSKMAAGSQGLAWRLKAANERYATDYPAAVGPHMTNTDSTPFMDLVPAVSLRENERGSQIGGGWDPHWHQPTDRYATFSDEDFRLGLNAAQTTLGAVAELAGATLRP